MSFIVICFVPGGKREGETGEERLRDCCLFRLLFPLSHVAKKNWRFFFVHIQHTVHAAV